MAEKCDLLSYESFLYGRIGQMTYNYLSWGIFVRCDTWDNVEG